MPLPLPLRKQRLPAAAGPQALHIPPVLPTHLEQRIGDLPQ